MNKGTGRVYEAGYSTAGWKKGARVRDVETLTTGTLIISVNHNFQSENLCIITEQRPHLPGVWASWANEDGTRTGLDEFSIHRFMLAPTHDKEEEFFLAVPAGTEDTADFILVIEMRYDDYEVHGSQQTPSYHRELAFATVEEAKVALGRVQEEIDRMPDVNAELFSVYVRSHEIPRGDPLEVLRETAGYFIFNEPTEELRTDPYWGRFSDEDLRRYQEKGKELA